jgi:Protein of unknown function (DUF3298)
MKAKPNTNVSLAFGLIIIASFACSGVTGLATPTSTATSAPPTTAAAVPLYQKVSVTSVASEQDSQSPVYKITIQTPKLTGSDDPRVKSFNDKLSALVAEGIAGFKQNLAQMQNSSASPGSSFDIQFKLLSPPGNVLSIKFVMEGYVAGAAHPYQVSRTENYDLEAGKELALGDLFQPNSKYLEMISKYCAAQLTQRNIGFTDTFTQGADPTADNYRNWNITVDGLLITFDEYQVAAYAAGPQIVTVPYIDLKSIIDSKGPLANLIK